MLELANTCAKRPEKGKHISSARNQYPELPLLRGYINIIIVLVPSHAQVRVFAFFGLNTQVVLSLVPAGLEKCTDISEAQCVGCTPSPVWVIF